MTSAARRVLLASALVGATAAAPAVACAQVAEAPAEQADAVAAAMERAVRALVAMQRDDGGIGRGARHDVALTALATMALLGCGHLPDDPTPEGQAVGRALDFILRPEHQTAEGYFGQFDNSRMYGHGIVTLLLGEVAGMSGDDARDALVRERLQPAVELILRSQAVEKADLWTGGWRYQPGDRDADLSITVWQVMALRSAQSAGVPVPGEAIEQAVAYLERSFRATEVDGDERAVLGRFGYRPNASPAQFSYSTTAAGLLAMQVCGQYDAPSVGASAAWLAQNPPTGRERWFYYGTYYFAQGMSQREGDLADAAALATEQVLLPLQRDDGTWRGSGAEGDTVYATSMALLSLSVENHFLPIYQR